MMDDRFRSFFLFSVIPGIGADWCVCKVTLFIVRIVVFQREIVSQQLRIGTYISDLLVLYHSESTLFARTNEDPANKITVIKNYANIFFPPLSDSILISLMAIVVTLVARVTYIRQRDTYIVSVEVRGRGDGNKLKTKSKLWWKKIGLG